MLTVINKLNAKINIDLLHIDANINLQTFIYRCFSADEIVCSSDRSMFHLNYNY